MHRKQGKNDCGSIARPFGRTLPELLYMHILACVNFSLLPLGFMWFWITCLLLNPLLSPLTLQIFFLAYPVIQHRPKQGFVEFVNSFKNTSCATYSLCGFGEGQSLSSGLVIIKWWGMWNIRHAFNSGYFYCFTYSSSHTCKKWLVCYNPLQFPSLWPWLVQSPPSPSSSIPANWYWDVVVPVQWWHN